jgi:hypothetical protein
MQSRGYDCFGVSKGGKCGGRSPMGEASGCPMVPGRKGASLFYMITLERWNVERKVTSAVKVHGASLRTLSYRPVGTVH